tara:strand:+ start:2096 stop:2356 length:261 start_codon:yes stop_codon:yes gene_type:complete
MFYLVFRGGIQLGSVNAVHVDDYGESLLNQTESYRKHAVDDLAYQSLDINSLQILLEFLYRNQLCISKINVPESHFILLAQSVVKA